VQSIRAITAAELGTIHQIDVSEEGTTIFVQHGTHLETTIHAHARPWLTEQDWAPGVRVWHGFVRAGGHAFGAFDDDKLIGFAVLRARLTEDTDQLAALYVDRLFRRSGVATGLVGRVVETARDGGARILYVSAARSEPAVLFYLDRGFTPLAEPHPELFELEPKDIHMSMALGSVT
jgi:GNAT superfamily N-acetyltransferase